MVPGLEVNRDKSFVQNLYNCGVLVGLTDQPATVGSAIQIEFQGQGTVELLRLLPSLLPVRAPLNQI